jgi:hypothetical protein
MKKILILVMMLFSITANAQGYLRAVGFTAGVKVEDTDEVVWVEKQAVDILIKLDQNRVTIYSNKVQEYRKIALVSEEEDMVTWNCADKDGTRCNFSLFVLLDKPDYICIAVEYDDVAWIYVTKKEN